MNPSQSVVITFKVYNSREQKKAHAASIFLEQASAKFHWWARGTPPPPSKTVATDQCTYCKGKGPWRRECSKRGDRRSESENSRVMVGKGNSSDDE